MINTNEIKRCNYILLDEKHFAKVIAITEKIITTENPNNVYTDGTTGDDWIAISDYVTPIPLTPKILKGCGFEKHKFGDGYFKNKVYYILPQRIGFDFCILYSITEHKKIVLNNIEYLHQLQNLYFVLTGEELTYNA